MSPTVSATIVTYNSEQYIRRCLETLLTQTRPCTEIIVVDNASSDATREIAGLYPTIRIIENTTNAGYCAAQNRAISAASGDWVLCVNPDTSLEPTCVEQLVQAGELHSAIGIVCPKILRMNPDGTYPDPPVLDSAGGYITPSLRHFDRGSQLLDYGQFDSPEYVFGYTGAIVLFRRTMIEDAALDAELLDNNFFYYREDADLSWRCQLLGWRCLYAPRAVGHHVRRVLPTNRRSLPAAINLHSTKNRFLMRINNITAGVYGKVAVAATIRDLGILIYLVLFERSSLPGLLWIMRNFRKLMSKRRVIIERARTSDSELKRWFSSYPVSIPLEAVLREQLENIPVVVPSTTSS